MPTDLKIKMTILKMTILKIISFKKIILPVLLAILFNSIQLWAVGFDEIADQNYQLKGLKPKSIVKREIAQDKAILSGYENNEAEQEEQDSPTEIEDTTDPFLGLTDLKAWKQPSYQGQENALGWSPEAFTVPDELKTQYEFWLKIYTQYSQDQGVIHDSQDLSFIYESLDFSEITSDSKINRYQKEHLRKKAVEKKKKSTVALLLKLGKRKNFNNLPPDELAIYKLFGEVNKPQLYKQAAKRVRFQLGQKDKVIQGIYFSGRYLEDYEKMFQELGLPKELSRLPFVESSYNVMARSKVGASGLWQLMPSVLYPSEKKNKSLDLRNSPQKAGVIAARVLKKNFELLQDWRLAVTAYNHGPYGIQKLVKRCQSKELADLADFKRCKNKGLGFASRNFYPSFMAILEIEKNATQYFGSVSWSAPLNSKQLELEIDIPYSLLLNWFDGNDRYAQLFNPHLNFPVRKGREPIVRGSFVELPKDRWELAQKQVDEYLLKSKQSKSVTKRRG